MFRIGEFSKIAQVSGRLLRYYDEIGLLIPESIDPETGYRYYSARQLPRLNRILVLKELGLSLEQITRLLEQDTTPSEIRGMLALRKAQIEQSVQEEMARLRISVPALQFLALREVLPGMSAIQRLVKHIYTVVPSVVGHNSLGNIAIVVHSPVYDPEALDVEIGYLLTGKAPKSVRLSEERVLTLRELPALDTVATLAHVGQVNATHSGYGELGTWIEQKGWQMSGAGREILMQLPLHSEEDEAVIEIQLPVSRIDEKLGLDFDVTSNSTL
jgi:DNA-binding transcriptional MerR regulator